jgi:CRISPR-associated protein Csm4
MDAKQEKPMQLWRFTLKPLSPFATPLKGDTLFGHLCWAIRLHLGEKSLHQMLEGYADNLPFCALADAFPAGYLPRPHLPIFCMLPEASADGQNSGGQTQLRKQVKSRVWLPLTSLDKPITQWLLHAKSTAELVSDTSFSHHWEFEEGRMHNSINRQTGTTGEGGFAPYGVAQSWYHPETLLDVYAALDDSRLSLEQLKASLSYIGDTGFGKDASTGLGMFQITQVTQVDQMAQKNSTSWLTLAPCVPQGMGFVADKSYWQPFTRYGRHGALAAVGASPYKNAVLMSRAGSVFTPESYSHKVCIGQGLGGKGEISTVLTETVHQGYAPVVSVDMSGVFKRLHTLGITGESA